VAAAVVADEVLEGRELSVKDDAAAYIEARSESILFRNA
jgi:hypothetical protein